MEEIIIGMRHRVVADVVYSYPLTLMRSGACGSPKALTLDHTVGTVPSWSKMKKSRSVVDVTHLDEEEERATSVSDNSIPPSVAEDRPGRSLLFVLDMDHTMVRRLYCCCVKVEY
jgi:hypothetical protein